jgi:hypothetical protein
MRSVNLDDHKKARKEELLLTFKVLLKRNKITEDEYHKVVNMVYEKYK